MDCLRHCLVIYADACLHSHAVDRKDQKILEKLRAERKAKLDELKERTNYYATQQLIQVIGMILGHSLFC